ncbi:MAG: hypothetical protein KAT27_08080, partial [Desulfobacterales bacterium]|nr:hypothetical protein [Desulfobacterales bacterium]
MKDPSDWKRMMFKGMKVWLHVDDNQQPVVHNNKVLIKYQLDQDHEYWVRKEAVEPIDPARLKKPRAPLPARRASRPEGKGLRPHHPFPPKTIVAYT